EVSTSYSMYNIGHNTMEQRKRLFQYVLLLVNIDGLQRGISLSKLAVVSDNLMCMKQLSSTDQSTLFKKLNDELNMDLLGIFLDSLTQDLKQVWQEAVGLLSDQNQIFLFEAVSRMDNDCEF